MRGGRAGKGQLSVSLKDKLMSENSKNLKMANQQTSEVLEQLKLYFLLQVRFTFPWEWNSTIHQEADTITLLKGQGLLKMTNFAPP